MRAARRTCARSSGSGNARVHVRQRLRRRVRRHSAWGGGMARSCETPAHRCRAGEGAGASVVSQVGAPLPLQGALGWAACSPRCRKTWLWGPRRLGRRECRLWGGGGAALCRRRHQLPSWIEDCALEIGVFGEQEYLVVQLRGLKYEAEHAGAFYHAGVQRCTPTIRDAARRLAAAWPKLQDLPTAGWCIFTQPVRQKYSISPLSRDPVALRSPSSPIFDPAVDRGLRTHDKV